MDKREEVAGALLEAGGDGAETLQVVEEDLDAIAFLVSASVEAGLSVFPGRIRVDDGFDA
jgi:hypothetical protein